MWWLAAAQVSVEFLCDGLTRSLQTSVGPSEKSATNTKWPQLGHNIIQQSSQECETDQCTSNSLDDLLPMRAAVRQTTHRGNVASRPNGSCQIGDYRKTQTLSDIGFVFWRVSISWHTRHIDNVQVYNNRMRLPFIKLSSQTGGWFGKWLEQTRCQALK